MGKCFLCSSNAQHRHHIKSKGSGGPDDDWNMMELCAHCHSHIHFIGLSEMVRRRPILREEIIRRGFEYCELRGKWFLPKQL